MTEFCDYCDDEAVTNVEGTPVCDEHYHPGDGYCYAEEGCPCDMEPI